MPGLINYPTSGFEQGYKTSTAGLTGFRTGRHESIGERKSEAVEARANEELEIRKQAQQQRADLDNFNKVLGVGKSMPQSRRGAYYSQMAESSTSESNKANLTYLSTVSDSVHKDLTTSYAQMGKYLDQQDFQSAKEIHIRMKTLYPDSPIVKQHEEILEDAKARATQQALATVNKLRNANLHEELIPDSGILMKDKMAEAMAVLEKINPEVYNETMDSIREDAKKAQGIGGTTNREQTKINFATEVAQSKLDAKLKSEGKPSREITQAEVGIEYEDIYTESVPEALAKAGGKSEVTLQQKEFEDFQKQVGDSDREMRKNIKSNAVIDIGLEQLQKGIISGTFAKAELAFTKALSKAGLVNPETQEKITTTESYAGLMGIRVGQVISLFGAGTGLSDADREFATKIAAGDITLDETSLNRLQKLNKQVLIEEAIIHNELIDEFNLARDDRGLKPSIRKKVDVGKFLPKGNGKQIDEDNAKLFFAASKGDPREAERLASEKGWKF